MKALPLLIVGALLSFAALGQESKSSKIPVYLSQSGSDKVGSLFAKAVSTELQESTKYEITQSPNIVRNGPKFFIDMASIDVRDSKPIDRERSAVSVVIEETLAENDTPWKWYHKIIVVDREDAVKLAKLLVKDMDARWCNTIRSSSGGCPKEELP